MHLGSLERTQEARNFFIRNTHSKYGPVFYIKHKVSGNLSSVSEDLAI